MANDLVDAILNDLGLDAEIVELTGHAAASPRIFEGEDVRRAPPVYYPYGVLVNVSGRYADFNGRGDSIPRHDFDLHWLHADSRQARRLVRLSVLRLRDAWSSGRLDTEEGKVVSLLPGSTRQHLDPRQPTGAGGEAGVIDAFVQLHFRLATNIG